MRGLSTRSCFTFGLAAAICIYCMIAASAALCLDTKKPAKPNSEVEHCRQIKNERARMRCYHEGDSKVSTSFSQQQPLEPGSWQLSRAPNPAGGPDSISMTKMVDPARSGQGIAGLTLRCAEGATTEVLFVLFEPLPLRMHPKVTVAAGATTSEFIGSVVTPGALVLLPEKASALVEGAWQSIPELAVSIVENNRSLHGVIPLADITTAMQTLQANCPKALLGH